MLRGGYTKPRVFDFKGYDDGELLDYARTHIYCNGCWLSWHSESGYYFNDLEAGHFTVKDNDLAEQILDELPDDLRGAPVIDADYIVAPEDWEPYMDEDESYVKGYWPLPELQRPELDQALFPEETKENFERYEPIADYPYRGKVVLDGKTAHCPCCGGVLEGGWY